jgi:two-component system chemotaxis sensor kinase CheA
VLIIGGSSGVGIVVDRLIGEQEIVVQAMNDSVVQITGIAGATELGDGKVVLILDVVALTNVGRKKLSGFQRT